MASRDTDRGSFFLARGAFPALLGALGEAGYRCIGPQWRDGAIVYDTLSDVAQLPAGRRDRQGPGRYTVVDGDDRRLFAWANGPQGLKPLVFAPRERLWRSARDVDGGVHFEASPPAVEPVAVIGVRACDLAALAIQDRVFLHGSHTDPCYRARREALFLVAVDCSHPAATCFCASTGDGPGARDGFDLVLAELDAGFVIAAGTDAGRTVLAHLPLRAATAKEQDAARAQLQRAGEAQTRALPPGDLYDVLFARLDHPAWEEIATRCLACGNCTMVCPTCFCHAEHDEPQLDGSASEHLRRWDSCFTQGHSYIHGLTVRPDIRSRYRQWLTHKLGSWHRQFGRSGCVGCGRCITWCPVGIDLTAEAARICHD